MTGYCHIDGIDIYTEFGVFIESGYDGLLSFPALKEPDKNDWPEEHGIEVDLTEPRLQTQEITIDFAFVRGFSWHPFYYFLTTSGKRTIEIPGLKRSWLLRVVEMPKLENYDGADIFSVKFVEDTPVIPVDYPTANARGLLTSVLLLDGKTWDKYGIIVTDGLDDLERAPQLKKALARTNSKMNGQLYDEDFVRYAEKEVTFRCCFNAVQMTDFWDLYNAFFGDLLKPGLRKIGYKGKQYNAFYKKTANWQLHSHSGPAVCEFELTMCFTTFVINNEIYLLASEDGELIITEDGLCIDLKY